MFIHHHSPLSPSPSYPEAFLQVNPLSRTFLLQSLVTALFSHPFGSGSGNSSMLLSSGNSTISVVPLHPIHTMEHYAFIIPSLDSTTLSVSSVSCWGLESYTGLRLFLGLKGNPACLSMPSLDFQGSGRTCPPRTTPYFLPRTALLTPQSLFCHVLMFKSPCQPPSSIKTRNDLFYHLE